MHIVVDRRPEGVALIDDDGATALVPEPQFAAAVAEREAEHPRWVWTDTAQWYPPLLAAGVRVERCHDLRLVDAIIAGIAGRPARRSWGSAPEPARADTLFDLDGATDAAPAIAAPLAWQQQRAAIAAHADPARLTLLAAAESAGALAAAEMQHTGLPWSAAAHDALLAEALGPRPAPGRRPARLDELATQVEALLGVGPVPIDSPPELVKALRRAGLDVATTRSAELTRLDHPAIAPLLQYKTLSRLHTANGWNWLDEWVHDGRFRPTFVPGGVVTGRWASDGGGALQLPKQVRGAVQADAGWALVVADAAQLEPRILAALSGDAAMARAGAGVDLYAGIVASGAVASREHAKVGMLGAMYGGTTGVSAQVLPRLARSFPQAIGYVEAAARAGERGERVTTRLGRTSPAPSAAWRERQGAAGAEGADESAGRAARSAARSWGRFTRNFVVQGTAAEWALAWMAGVRRRLWTTGAGPLATQPHLVFFVHDELIVHSPLDRVAEVEQVLREAAVEAGRIVFGATPVSFPVTVAAVQRYSDAK
ncbi:bifunctional 3'-5' exonuclease/DNA polymerase [Microcella humidisoli]|uniref:DNA-directed DNA polymerase n=1 Tax=Microcella humidisoli TaxID=2963406 RepID=A0ABY5FX64_9MICO|nr:bifunctional 3'-5' exonuclease/DNA polymerase [Microcella humidisoli]UTT62465.1 bifunctional 3'-5' exonuclease/DNA polymerase [Microcella humidisoli]